MSNGIAGAGTGTGRVRVLDFLRGFSVLSMVGYHAMYDLVYIFGVSAPWYRGLPGYIWQQSICWVFILVSGATQHYGRRPYRRAVLVIGAAALVSLVTALFMPSEFIAFGILHCLGVCMLLCALLRPALAKVPPVLGFVLAALLFVLTKQAPWGSLGVLDTPLLALPRGLYTTGFLFPLGFPGPGFSSADYFPLIPWLFLFLAGYFGWGMLKARVPRSAARSTPLEWVGKHSLLIYVLHQPLTYGVLYLLALLGVFA